MQVAIMLGGADVARTEAMDRAIKKYEVEKIDKVLLRLRKGEKEKLQQHAKARGESLNAFICRAIAEAVARDGEENE